MQFSASLVAAAIAPVAQQCHTPKQQKALELQSGRSNKKKRQKKQEAALGMDHIPKETFVPSSLVCVWRCAMLEQSTTLVQMEEEVA